MPLLLAEPGVGLFGCTVSGETSKLQPRWCWPFGPLRSTAEVFVWPCLLWWAVLSPFSRLRIDGVAVWHVRERCDTLRSLSRQRWGGQWALLYDSVSCHIDEGRIGSGLIRVLHHGDVWSSRPGSSTGTHPCDSLAKYSPLFSASLCSTSQRRWFALFPKFLSWLCGQ